MSENKEEIPPVEKQKLTVLGVLTDLENGLDRHAIKDKYSLSHNDMKTLFAHPKLKNKKAKREFEPSFILIDDAPDEEVPLKRIAGAPKKLKAAKEETQPIATVTTSPIPTIEAPTANIQASVSAVTATQEKSGEPIREVKGSDDNDDKEPGDDKPTVKQGLW